MAKNTASKNMNVNTIYEDRKFINLGFIKSVGMCSDEKQLFNKINEINKLKVLNDDDFDLLNKFAHVTHGNVVEWVVPVSSVSLCDFDVSVFKSQGYVDLISADFIASKLGGHVRKE